MQEYPYSNLHQLNLDWIVETVQKLDSALEFIDNLSSSDVNHGLSANMGRVLRSMIEHTQEMTIRTISSFAGEYNLTDLFLPGDVVLNDGKFYRAIAETSGAFHPEDWTELTDILRNIMSETDYINMSIVDLWKSMANRYDSETMYSSSDICWYGDAEIHLYRAVRNTSGQFNLNDWEEIAVTDLISASGVQSVNGKTGSVILDSDDVGALSAATTLAEIPGDSQHRTVTDSEKSTWDGKQSALVSGTNIKTINNQSLLGSGNIDIQSGGASFDDIFPVGSFWWNSATSSSPAGLGLSAGSWEQITDKFILAAGTGHAANSTGGAETHTLTISEMPSHRHPINIYADMGGGQYGGNAGFNIGNSDEDSAHFRTDYVGGDQAFSIMPPYYTAYCWHRIA